jgi:hypothetical protein
VRKDLVARVGAARTSHLDGCGRVGPGVGTDQNDRMYARHLEARPTRRPVRIGWGGYPWVMRDGRDIFAELQQSGLVVSDVGYDAVMADLVNGAPPILVLGGSHGPAIGTRVISIRQRQLLDELVAVARVPFSKSGPAQPPAVPWQRLADDLRRTAGRKLDLAFHWEGYRDGGYWMCELSLDGVAQGGCNVDWGQADPEGSLVDLADRLCEGWLHEEVWGGWPMCVKHPTRPMWAEMGESGRAMWGCEADHSDAVEIGQLGL